LLMVVAATTTLAAEAAAATASWEIAWTVFLPPVSSCAIFFAPQKRLRFAFGFVLLACPVFQGPLHISGELPFPLPSIN
jgi:hypothetical protein